MLRTCPACGSANRIPLARLTDVARCGRCKQSFTPIAIPVEVASEADFDALIGSSSLPVLVDFWADWCAPCRMVAPELKKVAQAQAGRVIVAKVDTEALKGVARRFAISGIPTMVLFRNGREVHRVSGAQPAMQIMSAFGLES